MLYRFSYFIGLLVTVTLFGWWLLINVLDMPTELDEKRQNALIVAAALSLVLSLMAKYIGRDTPPTSPH